LIVQQNVERHEGSSSVERLVNPLIATYTTEGHSLPHSTTHSHQQEFISSALFEECSIPHNISNFENFNFQEACNGIESFNEAEFIFSSSEIAQLLNTSKCLDV
jgi:hypothetical protein